MHSPSDKEFIIEDGDNPDDLEKQFQAYQLLIRNDEYLKDVDDVRRKYSVGEHPVEGDNPRINKYLDPADKDERNKFYKDVKAIAAKIQFPGEWEQAVRLHIVGYNPGIGFLPTTHKKIAASVHDDHIELKLYGDIVLQDMKDNWKAIKQLMTANQASSKSNYAVRLKPKLANSLIIFDLARKGLPPKQIADYCDSHGIKNAMQDYEVSKYIELARKQIAKIYA